MVLQYEASSSLELAVAVEWLEGGNDHVDRFDHWEGLVSVDLADGFHGCVEKLLAGLVRVSADSVVWWLVCVEDGGTNGLIGWVDGLI